MFTVLETQESTNRSFAVQDINRRAEYAYSNNRELFDSFEHQAKVAEAAAILKDMVASYVGAYETARPASSRRPAHTQVKLNRVTHYPMQEHRTRKAEAIKKLEALGLDLVYTPNTDSYSVAVF